ncbi:MAG: NADP-dependent oxidoreductase [Candidatus Kapaibacteriales bacterium]
MLAATIDKYGTTDNIIVKEVPKPKCPPDNVLIKIMASSVNDYDWSLVRGKPAIYRLLFGLTKPKSPILGMEMSGIIEEVGSEVEGFKVGDRVMSDTSDYSFGTFAEYLPLKPKALNKIPETLSFIEAAAIPHAFALAYQGLVKLGEITQGMDVLINGAGGGVGMFAFGIAKSFGCKVTGVDSGEKLQKMKAAGFDLVIDYKTQDFTSLSEKFDLILDAKTSFWPRKYKKALKERGKYITVGGSLPRLFACFINKHTFSRFTDKKIDVLAVKTNQDVDQVLRLIAQSNIKFNIELHKGLKSTSNAIQRFGNAEHYGKIVVEV